MKPYSTVYVPVPFDDKDGHLVEFMFEGSKKNLKPTPNVYVLTGLEIKKLIEDAFDYGYENGDNSRPDILLRQHINSLGVD